jgi:four helix bundle protein
VSVGANIVEGCHRAGNRAFVVFLHNALGSAAELQFQIELALELGFGNRDDLDSLHARRRFGLDEPSLATDCKKMLARLIASLRRRGD